MSDNDKNAKTSAVLVKEAELRYREARKHVDEATKTGDKLRALAGQMQFSFGRVLECMALMAKKQEEQDDTLKHLERAAQRAGHADRQ